MKNIWKFSFWMFVFIIICGCILFDQEAIAVYSTSSSVEPVKDPQVSYLEFMSVGDTGTGDIGQIFVAKAMSEHASKDPVGFVLMLGDNFYSKGVESVYDIQWESKFQEIYNDSSLQVPFYAVLGNHDHYGNPDAQVNYTNMPENSKWKMPSRYYSFVRSIDESTDVQFFALDTITIIYDKSEAFKQIVWLEEQLANSQAEWKIVFGHHPLYSVGTNGNNSRMIKMLEKLFIKYKVNVYIAGHDHDQQLLGPINGVHYIVSGAGSRQRFEVMKQGAVYADPNLGFVWFRISRNKLVAAFATIEGTKYIYVINKKLPL